MFIGASNGLGPPRVLKWVAAAAAVAVLAAVYCVAAFGACVNVPTRFADLCRAVGAPEACTRIVNAPGIGGVVTATISVNDAANIGGGHTATMAMKVRGRFAQISYWQTDAPPCFFSSCAIHGYAGPSENDVVNNADILLAKMQYQMAPEPLAASLRDLFGAPAGSIAYIEKVYPLGARVFDGMATDADSTMTVRLRVRFGVGGT